MKREKAFVDARRQKVLEILANDPDIKVEDLAEQVEVSLATIRRDLKYLADEKQITRFYGGAKVKSEKKPMDKIEHCRYQIAKYAASLVEDGDTIFINTSRNALDIIRFIQHKNVTVITNNGKAINYEKGNGISVILTGGELRYPKEAMVGDFAIRNLQNIYAKKAFVGCSGISANAGMMTENANEVNINHLMIEQATQDVYILADHTKIGKNCSFSSCGIDQVKNLITDDLASEEELELMRSMGVNVHKVKTSD